MKRIAWAIVAAAVSLHAMTMEMKEGWQLVGIPTGLETMSAFAHDEVELVWGYDASAGTWLGYSPDAARQAQIAQAGYDQLDSLLPYQAVWVKSSASWSLQSESTLKSDERQNDRIELEAGWNLVALPQAIAISPELFGDAVVWKHADTWEAYGAEGVDFPGIERINVAEGIWVKSAEARSVDLAAESARLHTFDDKTAMLDYIRNMIESFQYYYGYYDFGLVPEGIELSGGASGDSAENATTTNVQEEGVDESDLLKHDGEHIFYVDAEQQRIRITSFDALAEGDFEPLATIELDDGQSVQAMYLHGERLVLVTQTSAYYVLEGDLAVTGIMPPETGSNTYQIDILDVSDIDNIAKVSSHVIEGSFQQSRMIGSRLYTISRFYPQIEYEYPKLYEDAQCEPARDELSTLECYEYVKQDCSGGVLPDGSSGGSASSTSGETGLLPGMAAVLPGESGGSAECWYYEAVVKDEACVERETELLDLLKISCQGYYYSDENGRFKYDYDHPITVDEHFVPAIVTGGTRSDLVEPGRFYAPYKLTQRADVTTISAFDVDEGTYDESVSFLGNTHTYYASADALYLVSSEYPLYYDYTTWVEQQTLYKFALGETLAFRAKGSVEGRMLNQFSMSERNGVLRVATTTGSSWSPSGTQNRVFTLQEEDDATLQTLDTLEGLGKEGEEIYAVRFVGERGFVVTFQRTDPLYTIDLSDPSAIRKVGELEIPGYSEYFHPISETQLLSIGRDADENGRRLGLQVQLFDISDFANPTLSDKISVGDENTYSEAEYNHKAFIYRSSDRTFGLPYRSYGYASGNYSHSENFGIYRVEEDRIAEVETLSADDSYWSYGQTRGLIFDYGALTYGMMFKGAQTLGGTIE